MVYTGGNDWKDQGSSPSQQKVNETPLSISTIKLGMGVQIYNPSNSGSKGKKIAVHAGPEKNTGPYPKK
jgi:hypothetical protein